MDYLVGFLFGYFIKEFLSFIKRISDYDWQNRLAYDQDIFMPITEDDLP
jgi:hypothetical protein